MKRVLTCVLALTISMGICVPAFAEEEYFTYEETSIPVYVTSEATLIDITVTPSVAVTVDKYGESQCSEITCKNNNSFLIWIDEISVGQKNGWSWNVNYEDSPQGYCGDKSFYLHYAEEKYDAAKTYEKNMELLEMSKLEIQGGKTETIPLEVFARSTGKALENESISEIEFTFCAGTIYYDD